MYLEESNEAPVKKVVTHKVVVVPVPVEAEKTPAELADDFITRVSRINRQEFFSHNDLFNVREVANRIMLLERDLLDPTETGYINLPKKGFRFAYFPRVEEDFDNPHSYDCLADPIIHTHYDALGYFFYADEAYAYVGIPEHEFTKPYCSKFKTAFEDA